jgi:hypothetical protein
MEVIGYEADAKELDRVLRFGRGEQVKECGVIAILVENSGTTVSTIQNIVGVPVDLSTWNTRHETHTVCESLSLTQYKVAGLFSFSIFFLQVRPYLS